MSVGVVERVGGAGFGCVDNGKQEWVIGWMGWGGGMEMQSGSGGERVGGMREAVTAEAVREYKGEGMTVLWWRSDGIGGDVGVGRFG